MTGDSGVTARLIVQRVTLRTIVAECFHSQLSALSAQAISSKTQVIISFMQDEQLYKFESTVEKVQIDSERSIFTLRRPKRVSKVQRRFSYRVPVETRTTYNFLWPGPVADVPLHARIINLSEGGMLISTNDVLYAGAMLSINVPVGKDGEVDLVTAEVLEARDEGGLGQGSTVARLRFDGSDRVQLTDSLRSGIVSYLFEQQRLMLQTRRLLNPPKKRD